MCLLSVYKLSFLPRPRILHHPLGAHATALCVCNLQWKTISCSVMCCGAPVMPTSAVELKADSITMDEYRAEKNSARAMPIHPSDSSIALTLHQPLYPPGSIIHVVRHHPTKTE